MPITQLPLADSEIRPIVPVDHEETAISVTPDDNVLGEVTYRGDPADPGGVRADVGIPALIRDTVALLGPRAYAVVDLSVRRGLTDAEVGAIVGIRQEIASQTIARTKERVEHAVSIFVLVKTRVGACPGLRRVVGAHARASLGSGLADVVNPHLEECADCASAWNRIPPLLDFLRRLPVANPHSGLRERIREWTSRRRPRADLLPRIRTIHPAASAAVLVLALGIAVIVSSHGADAPGAAETIAAAVSTPGIEIVSRRQSPTPPGAVVQTQKTMPLPTAVVVGAEPAPTLPPSTTVVPSEPPLVTIITPVDGQRFDTTSAFNYIDLVAVVQDDIDEGLQVDWHLGTKYLGSGNAITVTSAIDCPDTMTYTISATATDSSANTTRQMVTFAVRCKSKP